VGSRPDSGASWFGAAELGGFCTADRGASAQSGRRTGVACDSTGRIDRGTRACGRTRTRTRACAGSRSDHELAGNHVVRRNSAVAHRRRA
jgi:hypothetical protein